MALQGLPAGVALRQGPISGLGAKQSASQCAERPIVLRLFGENNEMVYFFWQINGKKPTLQQTNHLLSSRKVA